MLVGISDNPPPYALKSSGAEVSLENHVQTQIAKVPLQSHGALGIGGSLRTLFHETCGLSILVPSS